MAFVGDISTAIDLAEKAINTARRLHDCYENSKSNGKAISDLQKSMDEYRRNLTYILTELNDQKKRVRQYDNPQFARETQNISDMFTEAETELKCMETDYEKSKRIRRFIHAMSVAKRCNELESKFGDADGTMKRLNELLVITGAMTSQSTPSNCDQQDVFRASWHSGSSSKRVYVDFTKTDDSGQPVAIMSEIEAKLSQPAQNIISVQGEAGVGKTFLLSVLSQQKKLRERFKDGIYWITLGSSATAGNVMEELRGLVKESGGEHKTKELEAKESLDELFDEVQKWLQDKTFLLLLDDIWNSPEQGDSLRIKFEDLVAAGENSAMVFSTRDPSVANIDGDQYKLQRRNTQESRFMLLKYAEYDVNKSFDDSAEESISRLLTTCNGLPVAVAVVGRAVRQLKHRKGVKNVWISYMNQQEDLLTSPSGRYDPLGSIFTASVRMLDDTGVGEPLSFKPKYSYAEMHRALTVLQPQQLAPAILLQHLWRLCNEKQAAEIGQRMESVGLVEQYEDDSVSDGELCLRFHDILLEFASREANENCEVGQWHMNVVEGFSSDKNVVRWENEDLRDWWKGDDRTGQEVRSNIIRHLCGAGLMGEAAALVTIPEWMVARFVKDGVMAYRNDVKVSTERLMGKQSVVTNGARAQDVSVIGEAAVMSSRFVRKNQYEVYFQLYSRLLPLSKSSESLKRYIENVKCRAPRPFLEPERTFLLPPRRGMDTIFSALHDLECIEVSGEEFFISGGVMGEIHVLSMKGQVGRSWKAHDSTVTTVAVTSEYKRIISGSSNGDVKIWEFDERVHDTGILRGAYEKAHRGGVNRVKTIAKGQFGISGGDDGKLVVWDLMNGERMSVMSDARGKDHRVTDIATVPDGVLVISGGSDGYLRFWTLDLPSGTLQELTDRAINCENEMIWCIALSCNQQRVVVGFIGAVGIWDARTGQRIYNERIRRSIVLCVAISDDGCRAASGCDDGTLQLWDSEKGATLGAVQRAHSDEVSGVAFVTGGDRVLTSSWDGSVREWQWSVHCSVDTTWNHQTVDEDVEVFTLSPDGRTVVSSSWSRTLTVWDVATGTPKAGWLHGHEDGITDITVSQDNSRMLSVSYDGILRVWDLHAGRPLASFQIPMKEVVKWEKVKEKLRILFGIQKKMRIQFHQFQDFCVAMAPNKEWAVTGGMYDGLLTMWDLNKPGGSPTELGMHKDSFIGITNLYVSDDGQRIISSSEDTVGVWDLGKRRHDCDRLDGEFFAHDRGLDLSKLDAFRYAKEPGVESAKVGMVICNGDKILYHASKERVIQLATMEDWLFSNKCAFSSALQTLCVRNPYGGVAFLRLRTE